jgi:hypothetical protein
MDWRLTQTPYKGRVTKKERQNCARVIVALAVVILFQAFSFRAQAGQGCVQL